MDSGSCASCSFDLNGVSYEKVYNLEGTLMQAQNPISGTDIPLREVLITTYMSTFARFTAFARLGVTIQLVSPRIIIWVKFEAHTSA
jgi:hypothetical protein